MNAYRIELRLTLAAKNSEEASRLLDQLTGVAEATGANFEGGYVERMADDEVIPHSPIARRLRTAQ